MGQEKDIILQVSDIGHFTLVTPEGHGKNVLRSTGNEFSLTCMVAWNPNFSIADYEGHCMYVQAKDSTAWNISHYCVTDQALDKL